METPQGGDPLAQVAERSGVQVAGSSHSLTQPSGGPEKTSDPTVEAGGEDATKQVFKSVARMTVDRVDRLTKNKNYVRVSSSFPNYDIGQAFTRGANDIAMVSFS